MCPYSASLCHWRRSSPSHRHSLLTPSLSANTSTPPGRIPCRAKPTIPRPPDTPLDRDRTRPANNPRPPTTLGAAPETASLCLTARRGRLLRGRRRRRRLAHRRLAARAPQDPLPGAERRARRVQAQRGQGAGQDVARGGLARVHARQRYQLHPHRALFGRAIWELQLL